MQVLTTWSALVFPLKDGIPANHKDRPSGIPEWLELPANAQGKQTAGSLAKSIKKKKITSTHPLFQTTF